MKPKLWDGPSAVGEAKVRQLNQLDQPFLTASAPGFMANKKNVGFTEVYQPGEPPEPPEALYLSCGATTPTGYASTDIAYVRGSTATHGGLWGFKTIPAIPDTNTEPVYKLPYLPMAGVRGGGVLVARYGGYGRAIYESRTGRTWKEVLTLRGDATTGVNGVTEVKGNRSTYGFAGRFIPPFAETPSAYYAYRVADGWAFQEFTSVDNLLSVHRFDTNRLLAFVASVDGDSYTITPKISRDDGETWSTLSFGTWLSGAYFTTVVGGDIVRAGYHYPFDVLTTYDCLGEMFYSIVVQPTEPGKCVIIVKVITADDTSEPRAFLFDDDAHVLYSMTAPPVDTDASFWWNGPTFGGDHTILPVQDLVHDEVTSQSNRLCVFNGTSWATRALPVTEGAQVIRTLGYVDVGKIFYVANESGQFRQYVSDDYGVTWKSGRRIYNGEVTSGYFYLCWVRDIDGSPAPTFPGAPWI